MLSYVSGDTVERSSEPYLLPPQRLPTSETQGFGSLEIQGECLGNLPPLQTDYIHRIELEKQILAVLRHERHPIITLVGRGGIGKTSLALAILHDLTREKRFDSIVWFSARDLDLLPEGSKAVRPHILNEKDIAEEFTRLVAGPGRESGVKPIDYLIEHLGSAKGQLGTSLFVFDNFETVIHPTELFRWIDTYLRSPNKVLITTRFRDFNGDYSIEVPGMTDEESEELIVATARRLGVIDLFTQGYIRELVRESDGHPYVLKILLGEVAKARSLKKVERIIAAREDILVALFERTFSSLSPAATRVFLLLSSWRSTAPLVAVEAVMLRAENERMDVSGAIEELSRSSFVDLAKSPADREMFISVPLVAAIFGKQKLEVSPMKTAVMADAELLHMFGGSQRTDIRHGVGPRITRLVETVSRRIEGKDSLKDYLPMLELIARRYPPAWLQIAELQEEVGMLEDAKASLRRFLESASGLEKRQGWQWLAELCRRSNDAIGEIHALVELAETEEVAYEEISNAGARFNTLLYTGKATFVSDERRILAGRLRKVMEKRVDEASATDLSRLAWLCLRLAGYGKTRSVSRFATEI